MKRVKRRALLVAILAAFISFVLNKIGWHGNKWIDTKALADEGRLGVDSEGVSHVYFARGDTPEKNMSSVLEMFGGIDSLIDADDIVVLKPNAQWWSQGTTNTNAMKRFIESVLALPNFIGEIIIAENHHFPTDNSRGWTTEKRNGDFNLNELVHYFQDNGHKNVTKYHWHDGGPSKRNMHGGAENGGVIRGPQDGDGYVWCEDLVYTGGSGKKVMMSYPVFTSSYSGITVDLKNGPWKNGEYLNSKIKLINFSALNHHSTYAGVTTSIKNYMGIVDLTCGYRGLNPEGFYNFHFVGRRSSSKTLVPWRFQKSLAMLGLFHMSHLDGGAIGYFMKHVRMADLNIVTADWVGWGSRTEPELSTKAKALLASTDPVALDYYAAKYVLLPLTPVDQVHREEKYFFHKYNDPDKTDAPLNWYLQECHNQGIGNLDNKKIKIHKHANKKV